MSKEMFLHRQFERQARAGPHRTAVIAGGSPITYGELNARANRLAHRLRQLGAGPETAVGVSMERSAGLAAALLGVWKAGAAYVPLDPDYPPERLDYMIRDSRVSLIVCGERRAALFAASGVRTLKVGDDGELADDGGPGEGHPGGRPGADSDVEPDVDLHPLNMAYIFYTSGSTGRPKGVVNTHAGVAHRVRWLQERFALGGDDRVLQKTPYSFDISIWELFWPLSVGACVVMVDPDRNNDSRHVLETLRRERVTVAQFVPTGLHLFLGEIPEGDLPGLHHVFCCGEALSPALQDRFHRMFSASLHNLYGPTEAAIFASHWACVRREGQPVVPIGHAVEPGRLYVLDASLRPVPEGEIGEICIGGVGVARCYFGRPDLTAERFVPDPFAPEPGARMYRTGDLGRVLPDGSIEFLGRNDDQVKIGGYRIELGEIESVLEEHPGVVKAAATVRRDASGDARLVAYYIPAKEKPPLPAELRSYLRRRLPDYMLPSFVVEMERFPLTPSGKTDRRALPDPVVSRRSLGGDYVPPQTPVEREIAAVWAELFDYDEVGIDDDFLDLGGHSLLALRMLTRLWEAFGVEVTLREMLTDGTTVRKLAALVEERLLAQADDEELAALLEELAAPSTPETGR